MNDQTTTDAGDLPVLDNASIDRIEDAVFAEIAAHRAPARITPAARRRRRRRGWLTGIGVAAAFAAGVMVTPPLLNLTQTSAGNSSDATSFVSEGPAGSGADDAVSESMPMDAAGEAPADSGRDIIADAHATLRVDDVADAIDAVAALAEDYDGYVEGTEMSANAMPSDPGPPASEDEYGWIAIRVPAADLTAVMSDLAETGSVLASSMSQQDVTSMTIDLRARVDAAQASVDRLTELMSQSGSVADLIDAEVALTDRQAQLESYTQQLAALEDQVAMASLRVQLTETPSAASAEPSGFADGLLAGWNGLIVSLNALVIAVGFLLPWLVIAGLVVFVILVIRRRHRRDRVADIS